MGTSSAGRDDDRAGRGGGDPLVAVVRDLGPGIGPAAADVILAGKVDVGSRSANLGDGDVQPSIERLSAGFAAEVEVGGLDDADDGLRRFGERGHRKQGQDKGGKKLGHGHIPLFECDPPNSPDSQPM